MQQKQIDFIELPPRCCDGVLSLTSFGRIAAAVAHATAHLR
jgi:hypothetical protein